MIRHSGERERNPALEDWTARYEARTNVDFFGDALSALEADATAQGLAIGLLGQRDLPGVTLRRAQAMLRWDLRPSLWSHAFVITGPHARVSSDVAGIPLREVALHSRTGKFPDPAYNAVTEASLGVYDDPLIDSNAAVLTVGMTEDQVAAVRRRASWDVNLDRLRYNLWEALGVWQTYLWSAGAAANPLREGFPVFSSAFVEYCFEAIQLDLAPGASERNSAPEHLWNAAVWWKETLAELEHPIRGCYVLRDKRCTLLDPGETGESPSV